MQMYKVVGRSAGFVSGTLRLSKKQYSVRSHALKHIKGKDDYYDIIQPVEFKRGELIGFDGEIGKTISKTLELVNGEIETAQDEIPVSKIDDSLEFMTKKELIDMANHYKISDYNKLCKSELIEAIQKAKG